MQEIVSKEKCTGCGACYNVCPKSAISIVCDTEGFEHPEINQQTCINCGLCQKVCPVVHADENIEREKAENSVQKAFAARYKNYEKRLISSSGGIFAALAEHVLEKGGIVVGVSFDEQFVVVQRVIDDKAELHCLQGSKYLQSKIDFTFKRIKEALDKNRIVLYSGLACQVEGLRSYLRKDYDNLYCLDLICMGIPSPKVWQAYLDTYFKGEKIEHVNFKDKTIGWNRFCMSIKTDKRHFLEVGMDNKFFQCMFQTYSLRPSCFNCQFKHEYRASDITLADCWGANREAKEIDDNKGLSSVIVHTQKGLRLWQEAQDKIECKELPLDVVINGNKNMVEVRAPKKGREQFYTLLDSQPKEAFQKYGQNPDKKLSVRLLTKLGAVFSRRFWLFDRKMFKEYYDYDMKFNASFRGGQLTKHDKNLDEVKYLKYYRLAQAARGSLWFRLYYYPRLVRFSIKTGIGLHDNLNIGKGLIVGHAGRIVMNSGAKFGNNIFMTHGVTIGRDVRGKRKGAPTIGNNVCIRCNSTVVGNITIGDDVLIVPNTFVNFDVPSHSVVIGNPATIHHRDNATEGHLGKVEP